MIILVNRINEFLVKAYIIYTTVNFKDAIPDEMKEAAKLLAEAMFVREKYMAMSLQENCQTTRKALNEIDDEFNVDIILKNRAIKADRHKGSYTTHKIP
jgi:hypothetical protein